MTSDLLLALAEIDPSTDEPDVEQGVDQDHENSIDKGIEELMLGDLEDGIKRVDSAIDVDLSIENVSSSDDSASSGLEEADGVGQLNGGLLEDLENLLDGCNEIEEESDSFAESFDSDAFAVPIRQP